MGHKVHFNVFFTQMHHLISYRQDFYEEASSVKQENAFIRALMWITGLNYNQIQEKLSQCSKMFRSKCYFLSISI